MARKVVNLTGLKFVPGTGELTIPQIIRREKPSPYYKYDC